MTHWIDDLASSVYAAAIRGGSTHEDALDAAARFLTRIEDYAKSKIVSEAA